MTDALSELNKLTADWPADNAEALKRVQQLTSKLRGPTTIGYNPDEILKVHPKGGMANKNEKKFEYEVAIVYSDSGAETFKLLKPYIWQDLMYEKLYEFNGQGDKWNPETVEKSIANSSLVVVILSKESLKEPGVIFAMETLLHKEYEHRVQPVIVHDANTCAFPGGFEQPNSVKHLFAEKAVTLLRDYVSVAADEILIRLEEIQSKLIAAEEGEVPKDIVQITSTKHKHSLMKLKPYDEEEWTCANCEETGTDDRFHCVLCTYDMCLECGETTKESIKTDAFLSHKRTTAQVIAGRLYEGLKEDYKIFLDSEAKFKIHDLEKIVEQTGIFVLILSPGYLDSYWCCQELRAALKFKRKTVVVRDHQYQLPPRDSLPKEFDDIKSAIYDSPAIVWMAEYNTPCVNLLKKKFLGPSAEMLAEVKTFLDAHDEELESYAKEKGLWKLSGWEESVNYIFEGMAVHDPETLKKIKALDLSDTVIEEEEVLGLEFLKDLETLDISSCEFDGSIKLLGRAVPHLKKLDISRVYINDILFCAMIRKLDNLEELDLCYDVMLTSKSLEVIGRKCKKLQVIKVAGCYFSKRSLKKLRKALGGKLKVVFVDDSGRGDPNEAVDDEEEEEEEEENEDEEEEEEENEDKEEEEDDEEDDE